MENNQIPLPFTLLAPGVAVGAPVPDGWQPLFTQPLLIIVGLTGVGKSTTLGRLAKSGLPYTLLPNRRELTDQLIIAYMQAEAGVPIQPVTDRTARFAYTRRYRTRFPGGMSHALTQLWTDPTAHRSWFLFDGLRGVDEVRHAVTQLPKAHFIVLHAPDGVRVGRLLVRQDAFDQVGTNAVTLGQPHPAGLAALDLPEATAFFSPAELEPLLALVERGEVTLDDLRAKVQIVVEERRNYDPYAANALLTECAPDRTLIIDTSTRYPNQVVAQIVAQLQTWGLG